MFDIPLEEKKTNFSNMENEHLRLEAQLEILREELKDEVIPINSSIRIQECIEQKTEPIKVSNIQSDICSSCEKSKYRCLTSSIYNPKKSVCPFCNDLHEETKEKYTLSKAERELRESLNEPNIITPLGYEIDEQCLKCDGKVEYGFKRVKLPNCEHLLHRNCFEEYWTTIIERKYKIEDQSTFEKNCNIYICQRCGNDVGLHFITYICPWTEIMKKVIENLEKSTNVQMEPKKNDNIDTKCCKEKMKASITRNTLYTSLKTKNIFSLNCKTCTKVFECSLKKFLSPIEVKMIPRIACSKCRKICLPFAFNRSGHVVCRKCFHNTKDRKYQDVFTGKEKISIV